MSVTSLRSPRPLLPLLAGLALGLLLPLGACTGGGSDGPTCTPLAEACNGRDDDCDGQVDDGYDAGAACTVGVGACQASGHKVCTASGASTSCDVAAGTPGAETCNGLDDDCTGQVDDGLAGCCVPAATRACGAGVGACVAGTETCTAERAWGACLDGTSQPVRQPGQVAERCNGVDDDCDGEVDEADAAGCTSFFPDQDQDGFGALGGVPACLCAPRGSFTATDGTDCNDQAAAIRPGATEVCNGADDDCDGVIDNLVLGACYTGPPGTAGVGRCAAGAQVCLPTGLIACAGQVLPQVEVCNGVDDDCDGQVDENLAQACPLQRGVCAGSVTICVGGAFPACTAASYGPEYSPVELICDFLDNNCNGSIDENNPPACP